MQFLPYFCSARTPARAMRAAWVAVACAAALAPAGAQVYRHVGPDGRVVYTDQPPSASEAAEASAPAASSAAAGSNAALPYALRQTASRFPVVLYTTAGCQPCDSARQWLQTRGVPFTERTVQTATDAAALQALSGQGNLPFATVGQQHLVGFSAAQWGQYIDAAGYPATSQLPARYAYPAPQPLTTPPAAPEQPAAAPQQAQTAPQPAAQPSLPPPGRPTRDNPAGIIF